MRRTGVPGDVDGADDANPSCRPLENGVPTRTRLVASRSVAIKYRPAHARRVIADRPQTVVDRQDAPHRDAAPTSPGASTAFLDHGLISANRVF
jgi:hypothetical protein